MIKVTDTVRKSNKLKRTKIKKVTFMKKSVISLVLIGGVLLVSNLTYAQDAQLVSGDNSITMNQADSNQMLCEDSLLIYGKF